MWDMLVDLELYQMFKLHFLIRSAMDIHFFIFIDANDCSSISMIEFCQVEAQYSNVMSVHCMNIHRRCSRQWPSDSST